MVDLPDSMGETLTTTVEMVTAVIGIKGIAVTVQREFSGGNAIGKATYGST
jgi:hypothetical protein